MRAILRFNQQLILISIDVLTTQSSLLLRLRTHEDTEAWSRFVRLYTPLIQRWVWQLGIQKVHADDVVQDIFVVLLSKVSNFANDRPDSFRGWLRTVTLNKCRDYFRKQNQVSNPLLVEQIEAAIDDPNILLTKQEYQTFLAQSALRLMRDVFSEATWKACWEHVAVGRTAKDVAQELGISENAVYLARGRVLKRLRTELEGLWE